ncbi:hypothetical protein [Pedobacter sp. W3I1]|uniref:hypothetical protein n=1 Tax=Pedobacter sp. W3I1 TaxID=3042291 RepID=UPI0027D90F41|nr:hypothetical protein [Pedobacter sp. W3I1]
MKKIFFKALPFATLCLAVAFTSCNPKSDKGAQTTGQTDSLKYTTTIDGKSVKLYTLKNKQGASVSITNYGGRVVSLLVPDKNNKLTDVGFRLR